MEKILCLVVGGVTGTLSRYFLAGAVYRVCGSAFPYGTLAVNLLGCFLIGFFAAISDKKFLMGPNARLLWMVGFCGAFTTLSTIMFETSNLLKDGETMRALLNVLLSVVVGFFVFRLGFLLGEII